MQIYLLRIIAELFHIKVSKRTLKRNNVQASTNLATLSDQLKEWNVNCLAVKIDKEQLPEIPYPAVAHLNLNSGRFVVLQKLENDLLHYVDPEVGQVTESIEDFGNKWTGVVLLIEANEKSKEDGYEEIRKLEIVSRNSLYIVWFVSFLFLSAAVLFLSPFVWPYYFLKIAGGTLCFVLFQKQLGITNKALAKFCTLGSQSNCDAVIHSPGSKLFGVITLSEIGVLYFIGGILTIMVSAFAGISISGVTAVLTFLVFPFTLVSVYYQWHVVKAWCPLCLVVMLVIWLEVISLVPLLSSVSFEIKSLLISGVGFSLPLVFWLSVRHQFMEGYRLPNLERSLNRFKRSEQVFQALLAKQPTVEVGNFIHEIKTGNAEAPIAITLVSNPNCGPCSAAHAAIEDLIECFEDKIKVNFRFTVNPNQPDSNSTKMVRHLIALALTDSNKCMQALSAWYIQGGRQDINQWINKYPAPSLNGKESKVKEILSEHSNWCLKAGITATPTLFINGKKYPEEYALSELKFLIRKLLEAIPDHEPEPVS
jgi:uncharacterized membrane protein